MEAALIDSTSSEWSSPSHHLARPILAAGSSVEFDGYRRPIEASELGWVHAAISSVLDRPHSQTHRDMGSLIRQSWSMRPWPCESGLAVVWWDEADAAAVVGRRYSARIGRIPVGVRFGPLTRVHAPPRWLPGAYAVRLATRSPVVIRRDGGKNLTHLEPTGMSIESALVTLQRKLGLSTEIKPSIRILDSRTEVVGASVRGKTGEIVGWSGTVDMLCSARARWLLECASRGLGLGGRGAYGFGAVHVTSLEGRT